MDTKTVIIIGAGPAGLTAAYQLSHKTDYKVIVIEAHDKVGGLSRTEIYNGNKIDIGPHRFFSKSDRVNKFWKEILPLDGKNNCWLSIKRLTRILFLKKFFDYPISLDFFTLKELGIKKVCKIIISYLASRLKRIKHEKNLEDFFINRFGVELYKTFFKDYTKKVWGKECKEIPSKWGEQRIKGISIFKIVLNAIYNIFGKKNKTKETSLIDNFFYPKYGAGSFYEKVSELAKERNAQILFNSRVVGIDLDNNIVAYKKDNQVIELDYDYIISSMPITDLFNCFSRVPSYIKKISDNLVYRDYIIVGLLLKRMSHENKPLPDNWIYIQEKNQKMGRLDIFNNFSTSLLRDKDSIWVGAEYFCNSNDELWAMSDSKIKEFAFRELVDMNLTTNEAFIDSIVIRQEKAYPAYFGSYNKMDELIKYLDNYSRLLLVGRNGQHKYNNMDHSILSAMVAVDNIIENRANKDNIWKVNTEKNYHE